MQNLFAKPEESGRLARSVVGDMIRGLLPRTDAVVQLVGSLNQDEDVYQHSLNVAVLSLTLAKARGLDFKLAEALGLGAMFHDIGKMRVPASILRKPGSLTAAEKSFLEMHPRYGEEMGKELGFLSPEALQIVVHHHETMDGKGYPDHLQGNQIPLLARIVAIANTFDNLCNPTYGGPGMTPYEALGRMYTRWKPRFDFQLLESFIRCMGVFPPGTVVKLSNGMVGMVVVANPKASTKPGVMVYDPEIPKEEALIIDLMEEPDIAIQGSIHPKDLSREIFQYLSPREQVSFYHQAEKGKESPPAK